MKAKQLIAELQKLNPNTEITIYNYLLKNPLETLWVDTKGRIVAGSSGFEIIKRRKI